MTDDQQDDPLVADEARRRRRGRWIVRGSAIVVAALVAGYGLGLALPGWLRAREERRSRACFERLSETGRGEPGACVARLGFRGVLGADRDAAAALERASAKSARELTTDLAVWRAVDAEARDAALRAEAAAGDLDDGELVQLARVDGAYAVAAELARATGSSADPLVPYGGFLSAAVIGDVDAIRAIAAPRVAAGDDGWGQVRCLVDPACEPGLDDAGLAGAVTSAQALLDRHRPLDEVVAALGDGDIAAPQLRTPWTLAILAHDADPAAIEALAAGLEAAAAAAPPQPPPPARKRGAPALPVLPDVDAVAALIAAWTLEVEAARIHAVIGDHAAAARALAAADRIAQDPRVEGALAVADTAGLRVAVLPPDDALAWLDQVGATGPLARLDRALALTAAGRFAEALGALDDVSPYAPCRDDDPVCDALAWSRLALLIRTGAVLPAPPLPADDDTHLLDLRRRVAIGATDASRRADLRWSLQEDPHLIDEGGLATPMVMYALGALASRDHGEDPEVLVAAAIGDHGRPRRFIAAMHAAAVLRMDDAAAAAWQARRERIDAAIAAVPAAARAWTAGAL